MVAMLLYIVAFCVSFDRYLIVTLATKRKKHGSLLDLDTLSKTLPR